DTTPGDVARSSTHQELVAKRHSPPPRPEVPGNRIERCRFPRAIGPDETRDRPRTHHERNIRERHDPAKIDRKILHAKGGSGAVAVRAPALPAQSVLREASEGAAEAPSD